MRCIACNCVLTRTRINEKSGLPDDMCPICLAVARDDTCEVEYQFAHISSGVTPPAKNPDYSMSRSFRYRNEFKG